MTSLKENVFVAFTPYHLISAFNLCESKFNSDEDENLIYFAKSSKTNYEIDTTLLSKNVRILRFYTEKWPQLALNLKDKSVHRFIFFQENSIFNKYLAHYLKQNGAKIILASDGTKPYGVFNKKHEFLSMLKDTYNDYKKLKVNNLKLSNFIWSKYYRYGSFKLLDEVWLQYPELFNSKKNKTRGKIVKLPDLSLDSINKLSKILHFDSQLTEYSNIILYFNQPFYSKELIEQEFVILDNLKSKYPDKVIYIKLHPHTNCEVLFRLKSLSNLNIIEDNMPAEFYLMKVRNSIILTGWSTAIMHDFPELENFNYYLYPIYKKTNDSTLSQINLIAFPHIKMIDSLNQLSSFD